MGKLALGASSLSLTALAASAAAHFFVADPFAAQLLYNATGSFFWLGVGVLLRDVVIGHYVREQARREHERKMAPSIVSTLWLLDQLGLEQGVRSLADGLRTEAWKSKTREFFGDDFGAFMVSSALRSEGPRSLFERTSADTALGEHRGGQLTAHRIAQELSADLVR